MFILDSWKILEISIWTTKIQVLNQRAMALTTFLKVSASILCCSWSTFQQLSLTSLPWGCQPNNPTLISLKPSWRWGAKVVNLPAKVIQDKPQMVMFLPNISVLFFSSCSFQLRHWLYYWPSLHPALWELLCGDVRWLLCHSAPHHCGGVWDLQCVLAVWSWQVRSFFRLWVTS